MILDGKSLSNKILENLKIEFDKITKLKNRKPFLTFISIGNDEASKIYIKTKEKACKFVGIDTKTIELDKEVSEEKLISIIKEENNNDLVDGILLQLPLPSHIDQIKVTSKIDYRKDVDGFNPINMGKLILNKEGLKPCTAAGIIKLLEYYNIKIEGSDVVIIGRSNIVGKPLTNLLINKSATVQVCHSKTKNIDEKISRADILITAAGYPGLINKSHNLKKGVCIIDVGINRVNGKICGDVLYDEIVNKKENKIGYITPVPGGVGPMTIASLIENMYNIFKNK